MMKSSFLEQLPLSHFLILNRMLLLLVDVPVGATVELLVAKEAGVEGIEGTMMCGRVLPEGNLRLEGPLAGSALVLPHIQMRILNVALEGKTIWGIAPADVALEHLSGWIVAINVILQEALPFEFLLTNGAREVPNALNLVIIHVNLIRVLPLDFLCADFADKSLATLMDVPDVLTHHCIEGERLETVGAFEFLLILRHMLGLMDVHTAENHEGFRAFGAFVLVLLNWDVLIEIVQIEACLIEECLVAG
uniref:Putative secreted protein n=1 Tax=Lutzomyia longipalpis TaxID=7200 RepID=A0A7G3APV0_LUTLO